MRAKHSLLRLYSEKISEFFTNRKIQYLLILSINFFEIIPGTNAPSDRESYPFIKKSERI